MCHHRLVFDSWIIGTDTLEATKLPNTSKNSMNFSSDAVPSIREVKLKFFLNSEPVLEITLQTELLAREVNELETVYALVQDLDSVWTNHTFKSHDYRASVSRCNIAFPEYVLRYVF